MLRARHVTTGGLPTPHPLDLNVDFFEEKPRYGSPRVRATHFWVTVIVVCSCLLALVTYSQNTLPTPRTHCLHSNVICEERAHTNLKYLVNEIGERVVGHPNNEERTVQWLIARLEEIQNGIVAVGHGHTNFEISVQRASGFFMFESALYKSATFDHIGRMKRGSYALYHNVTNILVRISGSEESRHNAVLISSHFDSGKGSPGAYDDGIPVVCMLELARVLGYGTPTRHSIILNFNGAEETGLQGAHGFVSSHPWASSVRVFINLEAGGGGGKELFFRTSPGSAWLAQVYAHAAPRPHGTVFAQDLFRRDLIPSDTDFRIYKHTAPGIDLAFYRNGYVYHTAKDSMEAVEPGSITHMAENTLAVALEVAELKSLPPDDTAHVTDAVFYDVLGLWMFCYSSDVAQILNLAVVVAICLRIAWFIHTVSPTKRGDYEIHSWIEEATRSHSKSSGYAPLIVSTVAVVLSWPFAIFCSCCTGWIMDNVTDNPLSWYSSPRFTYVLFGTSAFLGLVLVHAFLHMFLWEKMHCKWDQVQDYVYHAILLFYGTILGMGTLLGLGTVYLFLWWCIGLLIAPQLSDFVHLALRRRPREYWWVTWFIACLVPLAVSMDLSFSLMEMFVPLMGRFGRTMPADIAMAILTAGTVVTMATPVLIFTHRIDDRNYKRVITILLVICAVLLLAATFRFPYSVSAPKRLVLQQTVIHSPRVEIRNGEAAVKQCYVMVRGYDRVPTDIVMDLAGLESRYKLFYDDRIQAHVFECTPPPIPPPQLVILSEAYNVETETRTLSLQVRHPGTAYSVLTFPGSALAGWSLSQPIQYMEEGEEGIAGKVVLNHVAGDSDPWGFVISLHGRQPVDVELAVHFYNHSLSTDLVTLMDHLPAWTTTMMSPRITIIQTYKL